MPEQRGRARHEFQRFRRRADRQRMSPEYRRLTPALLLSLLVHALLLSLTFGGQGSWLPGFGFPWQLRRIEAPDLRVTVVPAQVIAGEPAVAPAAAPSQKAWVEEPLASKPALTPSVSLAPTPTRTAAAVLPEGSLSAEVAARPDAASRPDAATVAAPAQMPLRADRPSDETPPPIPAPAVIAVARTDEATWVAPVTPPMPTPVVEAASSASSASSLETATPSLQEAGDAAGARVDQETREEVVERDTLDASRQEEQRRAEQLEVERQQAARQVADRQEAARQEAVREEAAREEAVREEAARHEAARAEKAREEAAREEAARQEAARQEAARQEAARQEAARQEAAARQDAAARQEAARQEAARQEAARQEAARQEAARQEAARVEVARETAARREATLRAIGRQLDEEAARREAQAAAARLPPSSSSTRRYRLWGRTDPNAELILYAEAWSRKIQLNMTFDMVREAALQPHADPLVTVAIRSDGSVESVTFVKSSGAAALDEAIRRVVQSQAPYQAFPPGLAREFDVIEIRRTWYFDVAIRLY
ncbi:MAG: TonB family protein [Betaproteobacteria bacterium]|nr:TonB family protein [Betaproteobacteria bacterium]